MRIRSVYSLRHHDLKKAVPLLAAFVALTTLWMTSPPTASEGQAVTPPATSGKGPAVSTPVIVSPPRITSPKPGTLDTGVVIVAGRGSPGHTVRVYDGNRQLGTSVVQADGSWSLTLQEPLAEGDHTLTAAAATTDGHTSAASPPVAITVALPPLPTPAILWPITGQILYGGRPTLEGTAVPGSTVLLLHDDQVIGSVTVSTDGTWRFTIPESLAEGVHTLNALAEDATGRMSETSHAVTISVVRPALAGPSVLAPVLEEIIQGQSLPLLGTASPGGAVWIFSGEQVLGTVTAQADGRWTFRLPASLAEGTHRLRAAVVDSEGHTSPLSSPVTLRVLPRVLGAPTITSPAAPASVSLVAGRLTLSGSAQPGSRVEVRDGEILLGTTAVGADGRWTFSPPEPLSIGEHELRAVATDERGRSSPPSLTVLARVSAPPPKPVATPTPVPVPIITAPATAELMASEPMTVTGTAVPGTIVAVYDGETLLGSAEAGADGTWTLVLEELAAGQHALSALATDTTGRTSRLSEVVTVEVVLPPPLLPITGGDPENGTMSPQLES